jgi:hypothetical protein
MQLAMGAMQTIKETYLTLSIPERKQLISELIDAIDQEVPTETSSEFVITEELKHKHPLFELAGRWTKEEGDEMIRIIKEGDWIDDGSYD